MSEGLDPRSELARFLERHTQLYPGGIPQALLKPEVNSARIPLSKSLERLLFRQKISDSTLVHGEGALKSKLMFIRFDLKAGSKSNFSDPGGKLLQAAIEKGLKLKVGEVFVSSLSKGLNQQVASQPLFLANLDAFRESLLAEISFVAPKMLVLLGAKLAELLELDPKNKWGEIQGLKALVSLDVSDVAQDESLKKSLWEDLKLLV